MCQVVLHLGPARSGKTQELIERYRQVLRRGPAPAVGRTLWLTPNARSAADVRGRLLAGDFDACLAPGVVTFDMLTGLILGESADRRHTIGALQARELLRRTIGDALEAGQLEFFAAAATRNGFVDLLAEHIDELRRRGVSSAAYAKVARPGRTAEAHRELARLYAAYDAQLAECQLLDREAEHLAARDALAAGACRRFAALELVVVDGFTDFTHTQHDLLRLLAGRSRRLEVALLDDLPYDAPRTDLFAKTAATGAALRRHHPELAIRRQRPRSLACGAIDHVGRHLFRHPAPALPAELPATIDEIEIVEAAGAHDEILQIARRVKRLLTRPEQPAAPGDIVVVFRTLGEAAPRVREVFDQFGIPYSVESGEPIGSAPVVRTLDELLSLELEDWRFRRVVSVLANNTLTAIDPAARRDADWLVRDLQIAQGREKLWQRVERLAAEHHQPAARSERHDRRLAAAASARGAMGLLRDALDELPASATPTEWTAALAQLATTLGVAPFDNRYGDAADRTAWQLVVEHFAALERLDAYLATPARRRSLSELLAMLRDIAQHERLPRPDDDVGRVRVLAAPTARLVAAAHLFLAGMSEQAYGGPERAGRLASQADYRRFAREAEAATAAQDEMLLFYEVLTRAEESLTISFPALDDRGQALPPSPYVIELERTLGAGRARRAQPHLSPVPQGATPYSLADWRVQAMAAALQGDAGLLAGLFATESAAPLVAAIDGGVRIVQARAAGDAFGPAEGLLDGPALRERLARRFGPEHAWSPSQWERYAACPYKFYLEDVLRLAPLGELVLEIDFLQRGSLLHGVLADFHRRAGDGVAWAELQRDAEQFLNQLQSVLQEAIAAAPREGVEAALLELDRRQIEKWIARYREQHQKYDGAWGRLDEPMRPAHFELRFGPPRGRADDGEDPRSTDQPLLLDIGGEQVVVTGRIDRIDVGRAAGKTVFNVIDYKSGRRPTLTRERIAAGERLQPALYVIAAQQLWFGDQEAVPRWAGYWSIRSGITTDARYSLHCAADDGQASQQWQELRAEVVDRIRQFVHAIRGGQFPVVSADPTCTSRCEFNTVCRVAQVRSLAKTWPPDEQA